MRGHRLVSDQDLPIRMRCVPDQLGIWSILSGNALIVADLTAGTGRFNLAQGFVGTISGIGASLSTALSGLVAGNLGRAAGFLGIAAVALAALLLLWSLMPETHPSNRSEHL